MSQIPGLEAGVTVAQQGEHFLVRLNNAGQADTALAMNGRKLTDGRTPHFHRQEVKMGMDDIFAWVSTELKTQERSSNLAKAVPKAWSNRPARHTSAVGRKELPCNN